MSILFLSLAAVFILRGPLGRALGERIGGGRRDAADDREIQDLKAEVAELRQQLFDVQERLDFTERVLARDDHAPALPKGERER